MSPLPTQCAVCRGWSAQHVCSRKRHAAAVSRCGGCAIAEPAGVLRCGAHLTAPLAAVAAVDCAFPWSSLVTALKFHAALVLAVGAASAQPRVFTRTPAP